MCTARNSCVRQQCAEELGICQLDSVFTLWLGQLDFSFAAAAGEFFARRALSLEVSRSTELADFSHWTAIVGNNAILFQVNSLFSDLMASSLLD